MEKSSGRSAAEIMVLNPSLAYQHGTFVVKFPHEGF
jgi:hypothetical protein